MTVKLESPRPSPAVRTEVRSPVSPGIAPGEPVPTATPGEADGFERASQGASPVGVGGSRFEQVGAVQSLSQPSGSIQRMADDLASLYLQEHGGVVGEDQLKQAAATFYDAFRAAGHTVGDSVQGTRLAVAALGRGSGTGGSSTQGDGCYFAGDQLETIWKATDGAETVEDFHKVFEKLSTEMKPREGQDPEMFQSALSFELGKIMVERGVGPGGSIGGRLGLGGDGFQRPGNGGFVPGDRLEGLPRRLEPHRPALEKLTDQLLRDSKLENGARLRKALWGELKKLPFPNDGLRRDARQHLLEEIALRQDRFLE